MLDQRGFSLTEVMVSMVIVPIAILGVTSMFQHANAGLQDGGKHAKAVAIAEGRLEVKRIVPWERSMMWPRAMGSLPPVYRKMAFM